MIFYKRSYAVIGSMIGFVFGLLFTYDSPIPFFSGKKEVELNDENSKNIIGYHDGYIPVKDSFHESEINGVAVHEDGSITLPSNLLNNLQMEPLESDLALMFEELPKFGFSEFQIKDIYNLYDDAKFSMLDQEKENYKLLVDNREEVLIKISGDPKGAAQRKEDFESRLKEIGGAQGQFLVDKLGGIFRDASGAYGKNDRIIKLARDQKGAYKFFIINLFSPLPDGREEASFEQLRRLGSVQSYSGNSVPDRLRHFFEGVN